MLEHPPYHNLCRAFAMIPCNPDESRVIELVCPCQRAVRLKLYAIAFAELEQFLLVEESAELHLVHCRNDIAFLQKLFQVPYSEIAYSDGLCPAVLLELIKLFPAPVSLGNRPMYEVEVNIVKAKPPQAVIESHGRVAVVIVPELCCYEKFFPWNAAFPDGPAYLFFIAVYHGCVYMPVSELQRIKHSFLCVACQFPCAEAQHGDFCPVVQLSPCTYVHKTAGTTAIL